jgi:hypothetical protein
MFNEKQLIHIENLLIAYKKCKFEGLFGMEVLALADAIRALDQRLKEIKEEAKKPKAPVPIIESDSVVDFAKKKQKKKDA